MYLLKPRRKNQLLLFLHHSHSTMYLLKLANELISLVENAFTFHHVSIKTDIDTDTEKAESDSHSTMYLLKPVRAIVAGQGYDYSHSTMYLLKPLYIMFKDKNGHIHIPPCIY